MDTKTKFDIAKDCFEVAAYVAALAFFLYRALSGYFIVDMSVKVSSERRRRPGSDNVDYLAIAVTLKKGERGGVRLHDAQVRLQSDGAENTQLGPKELITIMRVNRTDLEKDLPNVPKRARIDWTLIPPDSPRLNLPPGDETQLTALFEADAGTPYVIDVVILARRIFYGLWNGRLGQWRASSISLPVAPKLPPPENA